ncbi:hypothetical protein BH20ACT6_BH20ACT6_20700 [soil metagenome]
MDTHGPAGRLVSAIAAASVAELAWIDPAGRPAAVPVVPLLLADEPAVAVPYAFAELACRVGAAPRAALVLSDPRMTGGGWQPLAAIATPRLVVDDDGSLFAAQLLDQELRKYPPSRALVGSPLLRREHWWYLPRLVLRFGDAAVAEVGARAGERDGLLVSVPPSQPVASPEVDTVQVEDWGAEPLRLGSLSGRTVPTDGRSGLLMGHDFSVPDLERWSPHRTYGRLAPGGLVPDSRPTSRALEPVPGLFQRIRRQRELERRCRRALSPR